MSSNYCNNMATSLLESDFHNNDNAVLQQPDSKPRVFGKKSFYKKRGKSLEQEIERLESENKRLKGKYHEIKSNLQDMYQKYGDHYVMYVQCGDGNVMAADGDLDTGQVIGMLNTILSRTTSGLEESIKKQAEITEKMESLKNTMITLQTKFCLLETQSVSTLNKMDRVRRDSTSVRDSMKQLQELIKIAQNPEPTQEVVTETIEVITNRLLASSGEVFSLGIHELPQNAQKLPNMLAIKYGSRHEKKLQNMLTGSELDYPGLLEDKCFYWLTIWVKSHIHEEDPATTLLRLLRSLDEEIIKEQEDDIIQRNIHDKRSISSRSSVTLTPQTCLHRDVLAKLNAMQTDNQRGFSELRQQLDNTLAVFKAMEGTYSLQHQKRNQFSLPEELKLRFDHFK